VNGTPRTVKVSVKGYTARGNFAIYTLEGVSVWNGSSISITGDVGSDGYFDFSGHPGITGSVEFDGPGAGWYGGIDPGGYTVSYTPKPIVWPTVDQIANTQYGAGGAGLAYFATHNDNASAGIVGCSITSSITLHAGNYYLTNINLTGSNKITFDNSAGPVNLWIGPSGGTGTCKFRGGTAAIKSDPSKLCNIYVGTASGINLAGNEEIDANIYAFNSPAGGDVGYVINSGNPTINGQIITKKADINGNLTVNYVPGAVKPTSIGYYGFDNSWLELNAR
jgi:hypothetical protein